MQTKEVTHHMAVQDSTEPIIPVVESTAHLKNNAARNLQEKFGISQDALKRYGMSADEARSRLENPASWVKKDMYKEGGYGWMLDRLEKMKEGMQSGDHDAMDTIGEDVIRSFTKDSSLQREPMLGICAFTIVNILRLVPSIARRKDAQTMKMISEIDPEKLERNLKIMEASTRQQVLDKQVVQDELRKELQQTSYGDVEKKLVDQLQKDKADLKPGGASTAVDASELRLGTLRSMRLTAREEAKRTTFTMRRTFADVWGSIAIDANPADLSLQRAIETLLGDAEMSVNDHLDLQLTLLCEQIDTHFPEKSYQIGTSFKLARAENRCVITLSPSGEKPIVLSLKKENGRYIAESTLA